MYSLDAKTKGASQNAHSKFLVKVEVPTILVLLLLLSLHNILLIRARHHAGLLVIADAFFKEVGLACEGDGLHKVERVGSFIVFLVPERKEQTIGHELNVLLHEIGIHTQQRARQGLGQELLLNGDGFGDDVLHGLLCGAVVEVGEEQAGEVGVHALVAGDEFVGKGEARHQAAFLEPEDGGEGAAEENAFDGGEGDEPLGKGGVLVRDPF